jgi:UDP-N-acetyl-D-glucosamine dehydrogenase
MNTLSQSQIDFIRSKIQSSSESKLLQKLEQRTALIGIIGLGYVGLPIATHFTDSGFNVLGFDVDADKVEQLQQGRSYIKGISDESIKKMLDKNKFQVTLDKQKMKDVDCLLICVPTPLTEKMEPDLSYLIDTTEAISKNIRKGQLIVLESTSYPGTTEELILPKLEQRGLKVGKDFFLAFSPEREDPGNKVYDASNTPKVVGGATEACSEVATCLYGKITKAIPVSSCRVAEMTKLLENTFRGVNIALVNELKILCHKMGIDIFEVIEAAKTKPFGFKPFYPGPGLGGHCIPIDPFYLSWKAKEFGFSTKFIHLAGETNVSMPDYVVERTSEALNNHKEPLNGSNVLILGVGYKKDIDDDRESPSYQIMEKLREKGAVIHYNDPWVPKLRKTRKFDFDLSSIPLSEQNLKKMHAIIIVTDHSDYDFDEIVRHSSLVVDTRNATEGIINGREKIFLA